MLDHKLSLPMLHQEELCEAYTVSSGGIVRRVSSFAVCFENKSLWYGRTHIHDVSCLTDNNRLKLLNDTTGLLVFEKDNEYEMLETYAEPLLRSHGFSNELTAFGMELDLDNYQAFHSDDTLRSEGRLIKITAENLDSWTFALDLGYVTEEQDITMSIQKEMVSQSEDGTDYHTMNCMPEITLYGYVLDGIITGTIMIFMGKTAGIHEVSVLPEYRRHGIASELIKRAIMDISSSGYKTIYLLSTPMAHSLYQSFGFSDKSLICHYRRSPNYTNLANQSLLGFII